jgi:hypothetical protein
MLSHPFFYIFGYLLEPNVKIGLFLLIFFQIMTIEKTPKNHFIFTLLKKKSPIFSLHIIKAIKLRKEEIFGHFVPRVNSTNFAHFSGNN